MASRRKTQKRIPQKTAIKHTDVPRGIGKTTGRSQLRRSSRLFEKTAGSILGGSLQQEKQQAKVHKKRSLDTDTIEFPPPKRRIVAPPHDEDEDDDVPIRSQSIDHWRTFGGWPKELFEMDNHIISVETFRARKRAESRKRTASVSNSFNEQNSLISQPPPPPINKNEYLSPMYKERLAQHKCFMSSDEEPAEESLAAARALLKHRVNLPQQSLFDDAIFKANCKDMLDQNEARVVRDYGPLIFPSPWHLFLRGELETNNLTEMYNGVWAQAIGITNKQPMPDGSVGFRRSAFSSEQLAVLCDSLGDEGMLSYFAATLALLFPFITVEVKTSQGSLGPADNANAHSIFIAVRAIVNLYQLAGLDTKDLHQTILGFSVSHNDEDVRIWGYYPFVQDGDISYHRYSIKKFSLQEEPEHRWAAYRFVAGVYNVWAETHLVRIKNAINTMIENRKKPNVKASMNRSDGKAKAETPDENAEVDAESDRMYTGVVTSPVTSKSSLSWRAAHVAAAGWSSTTPSSKGIKQKSRKVKYIIHRGAWD